MVSQLTRKVRFAEPCAADGQLIRRLQWYGHDCVFASDTHPEVDYVQERDALTLRERDLRHATHIITNPPWTRKILFPMIEHFRTLKPTWLLFDADVLHNVEFAPYLKFCKLVVSIGRVKWIPDSEHSGVDNICWYYFPKNYRGLGPTMLGRVNAKH